LRAASSETSLGTLLALFLRMGATTFGGPAAHIALLRREAVERRGWLTDAQFLDLLGATNLIPGPNSTEMVMHVGWVRRGLPGLLVAGLAFIVPAMLITGLVGWAYTTWGTLPEAGWLLYGVKPVMLAVVVQAIAAMARKAAPNLRMTLIALFTIAAALSGVNELAALLGAGLVAVALAGGGSTRAVAAPVLLSTATAALTAAATPLGLFAVFLKIGAVLYGSGYVLLAFLRADLVERLGWLTEAQLMDAIAVGQITPGPVFTTATFIGWVLAGPWGALWATIGIFLPAFVFVALSGPLVPRLRRSPAASAFLDGVNAASLALMALVTAQLAGAALVDVPTLVLAALAAVALLRFDLGSTWLIAGGAAAGWALHAAGLA
jgi:chromate transporter